MPILRFKCAICPDSFQSKAALLKHSSSIHSGKLPAKDRLKEAKPIPVYQCQAPGCGYEAGMDRVQEHILATHVHLRHKCPQPNCGKDYSTKKYLKVHLQTIHPDAPSLPIPELSQEAMNQLIAPYLPQTQYKCDSCAGNFESKHGLSIHLNKAHPDRSLPEKTI